MTKRKIGLFCGSFDPIHHGHLIVATKAMEQFELHKVIFVPTFCSPHKLKYPPIATPLQRFEMIKRVCKTNDNFLPHDIEIKKDRPSFTIETVKEMKTDSNFLFLIIGSDQGQVFDHWKNASEIKTLANVITFKRPGFNHPFSFDGCNWDISSTEIRERVKAGKSIKYLVPDEVETYIRNYGIYR